MAEIAKLGIVITPGVILDGKLVHAGGIPKPDKIEEWLSAWGRDLTAQRPLRSRAV